MLVESCVGKYVTHDDLVNGADKTFQSSCKLPNSQNIIKILFNNDKNGTLTRTKECTSI